MSFICRMHNYTEYNEEWNVFSAFNPSKCTHLEQWAADCAAPGEQSWTSCRSRDSNPQPWVTLGFKSNALSIRPTTAQFTEFTVHHTLRLIRIILWCHMYNSVVLCWCFDVVSIISYTISCGERVWLSILRVYKWHLECWSHPPPRSSKNLWRITSQLSLQSLTGFVFSRSWLPRVRTSLNRSLLCCGMET